MMFKLQSLVQDKLRHAMDVRQHLKLKKARYLNKEKRDSQLHRLKTYPRKGSKNKTFSYMEYGNEKETDLNHMMNILIANLESRNKIYERYITNYTSY